MQKILAIFLLWFWTPLLLTPCFGQQAVFYGMNNNYGPSAPAYSTGCNTGNTSGTTANCAVTVAAGDFVAIYAAWIGTGTLTLTDSAGTPVAALASHPVSWATGSARRADMFYVANATSGAHTITMTTTSSTFVYMMVADYTGAATTSPIDGTPTGLTVTASTNPTSCTAITTTQANDVLIAGVGESSGSVVLTAGTGYTMRQQPTGQLELGLESSVASTATTYTPTYNTSTTTAGVCIAMAVKHV